jgi:hypothetical protein
MNSRVVQFYFPLSGTLFIPIDSGPSRKPRGGQKPGNGEHKSGGFNMDENGIYYEFTTKMEMSLQDSHRKRNP